MYEEPRMSTWILAALATALLATLAYFMPQRWQGLRFLFILVAIIFAFVFILSALDWFVSRTSARIRDIQDAKVHGAVMLADSLRPLNSHALDIVARHDVTKVYALPGEPEVQWAIKCPGMDVPLEFAADYLEMCQQSYPYLWPVGQAHKIGVHTANDTPWVNAERLAAAFTDLLVKIDRVAEPANGPSPARLTVPLEKVCNKYRIVL